MIYPFKWYLITLFQFYFDAPRCMIDSVDWTNSFQGAPPQSSLRPGYRNRGLVCRGCRTWCSSHMPSETGNSKSLSADIPIIIPPKFTGWHSLLESNSNEVKTPPWTYFHQTAFFYHLMPTKMDAVAPVPRPYRPPPLWFPDRTTSCGFLWISMLCQRFILVGPPQICPNRRCLLVLVHQIQ